MFTRMLAVSLGVCALLPSGVLACGGGGVFSEGVVQGHVQRVVLSVRDGGARTEVITQVEVEDTRHPYALLIPVPSEPTLDPMPIAHDDLMRLDEHTRVTIERRPGASPRKGCGGLKSGSKSGGGSPGNVVEVGDPVAIGPITAVAIRGSSGSDVVTWLGNNGFDLIQGAAQVIEEYAGGDRWFVAVKRRDGAELGGATSIGIHFTLQGDHRSISLPFARFGAADELSFVVFVAAERALGPGGAFRGLTLDDLSPDLVGESYYGAISAAVAAEQGKALVIEGVHRAALHTALSGTRLVTMFDTDAVVTRMTGVFARTSLDQDLLLTGEVPKDVPTTVTVGSQGEGGPDDRGLWIGVALLSLAFAALRRPAQPALPTQRVMTSS